MNIEIVPIEEVHFKRMVPLLDLVIGTNFMNESKIKEIRQTGISNGLNSSFVLLAGEDVIGLRLTVAAGNWDCTRFSSKKWGVAPEKVCYFHLNCVHPKYRGGGWGQRLLQSSIEVVKQQGAVAGVADIWLNSPRNSAYRYFSRAGARVVNIEQDRWVNIHSEESPCNRCGPRCECLGAEMILYFGGGQE